MANANQIPELISGFNAYTAGEKLIGITGEMTLPSFTAMTSTVSGPGLIGEYETPVPGFFSEIEQTIPFRLLYGEAFTLISVGSVVDLTLRGSMQMTNGMGDISHQGVRIVMRGRAKKFEGGKFKAGEGMEASVTLGLVYLLIEVDGKSKIELDKLNCIYKVNGLDQLEQIRRYC